MMSVIPLSTESSILEQNELVAINHHINPPHHHKFQQDHQLCQPISAQQEERRILKQLSENNKHGNNNNSDNNNSKDGSRTVSASPRSKVKGLLERGETQAQIDADQHNKEIQQILNKASLLPAPLNLLKPVESASSSTSHSYTIGSVLNLPDHWKLFWDWIIIAIVCYTIFQVPMAAFYRPQLTAVVGLVVWDYIVDFIYLSDLILHFNSAFIDEWGAKITDRKLIRRRYMTTGIALDLISLIPLELIFGLSTGIGLGSRGFACLRLIRLIRVQRMKTSERLQSSIVLFRLLRLLVALFVMVHWMGSLFFGIGVMQTAGNSYTGERWVYFYGIQDADLSTQYVNSVYWAVVTILTVGFGDITPHTNAEKLYTCFVIIAGSVFYAIVFGNIALLIQNLDISYQRYRDKLDSLEEFIKIYKVPNTLANNLRNTHKSLWQIHKGIEMNELIDELPPSQRTATRMFLHKNLVQKLDWFQRFSTEFIENLVTRLTTEIYLKGEFIFKQGELPSAMYFLARGSVRIYNDNFSVEQGENTYFGEIGLVIDTRRTASVVTLEHSELCVLSKEDFFEVLNMFPQHAKDVLITAHKRHKNAVKQNQNQTRSSGNNNTSSNKANSAAATIELESLAETNADSKKKIETIQEDKAVDDSNAINQPINPIAVPSNAESEEDSDPAAHSVAAARVGSVRRMSSNKGNKSINSVPSRLAVPLSSVHKLNRSISIRYGAGTLSGQRKVSDANNSLLSTNNSTKPNFPNLKPKPPNNMKPKFNTLTLPQSNTSSNTNVDHEIIQSLTLLTNRLQQIETNLNKPNNNNAANNQSK
jgi:CRP-like cAMP-binding protein